MTASTLVASDFNAAWEEGPPPSRFSVLETDVSNNNTAFEFATDLDVRQGPEDDLQAVGLPAGWLAVNPVLYRWNGSQWAVCWNDGWTYSAANNIYRIWRWLYWTSTLRACGSGYYGNLTNGYYWDGGAWRGSAIWSGYQFFGGLEGQQAIQLPADARPPAQPVTPGSQHGGKKGSGPAKEPPRMRQLELS